MVTEQMQHVYEQLLLEIESIKITIEDQPEQAKSALRIIKQTLEELEEQDTDIRSEDFNGNARYLEKIYGLKFYYKELIWMIYNKPIGNSHELKTYYQQEIDYVRHFICRHAAQYQHHKINMMELDLSDLPAEHQLDWSRFVAEDEAIFNEGGMTARFIGYEHLLEELFHRIRLLEDLDCVTAKTASGQYLTWTGKIVNLVELAYGLYETGQINNGQATLADILRCMQVCFQVHVKGPYRIYQDLMYRKTISPVEFLQQMQTALLSRLDADLSYKP